MNHYCAWWLYGAGIPLAPCVHPAFLYQPPIPPGMVWWWPGEAPRRRLNGNFDQAIRNEALLDPKPGEAATLPVGPLGPLGTEVAEQAGPGVPDPLLQGPGLPGTPVTPESPGGPGEPIGGE